MYERIEHRLFDRLFREEYSKVLALARRVAGPSIAADVAQDAFAALLRAPLHDPAHARNWLYRTALHRSLDSIKRDRSRRARELYAPEPVASPQPLEMLEQQETAQLVRRALANLKPHYAAALSLRSSGFSYKEIASMLDVSVDRVGVMLVRAEAALKKELIHVKASL